MVAAEGGAQLTVDGLELGTDEHRRHREAVADALGHGDHVGADAGVLVGEEPSAAAVSALDFVEDEDGARRRALLPQCLHEGRVGHLDATHALDSFNNHGADVALAKLGAHGFRVVQGQRMASVSFRGR